MAKQFYYFSIIIVMIGWLTQSAFAQKSEGQELLHWQLFLGGSSYYISRANNWNFGPELTINYLISQQQGILLSVIYPFTRMTSRGYGFREGLASDFGYWLAPGRMHPWLRLGAGFNYIFGSDSDGSLLRSFGTHISVQVVYWLKNSRFGLQLKGVMRYWFSEMHRNSRLTSSYSAGIAFQF